MTRVLIAAVGLTALLAACSEEDTPDHLVFLSVPSSASATSLLPEVQVGFAASNGSIVGDAHAAVQLELIADDPAAEMLGTAFKAATAGVSRFDDLIIRRAGDYRLRAISTINGVLDTAVSEAFTVTPGAATALMIDSVSLGMAGLPFYVRVKLADTYSNAVVAPSQMITLTATGIAGTLSRSTTNGVAIFDDLVATTSGGRTITASTPGLLSATAAASILAGPAHHITWTVQPQNGRAGVRMADFHLSIRDAYENPVDASLSSGWGICQAALISNPTGAVIMSPPATGGPLQWGGAGVWSMDFRIDRPGTGFTLGFTCRRHNFPDQQVSSPPSNSFDILP